MSIETDTYKTMSGAERGIEAIKELHRIVRHNLIEGTTGDAVAAARVQMALQMLGILRPDMTPEGILTAALRRIQEGS